MLGANEIRSLRVIFSHGKFNWYISSVSLLLSFFLRKVYFENLFSDSSHRAWECVQAGGCNQILDVVMDNAGFELFTDLCLADYLVTSNLVKKVIL